MAEFKWRAVDGAFNAAANWANTTLRINPARVPPGPSDNVTLDLSGGSITGTGTVAGLTISGGLGRPWNLAGLISAETTSIAGRTLISGELSTGELDLKSAGILEITADGSLRATALAFGAAGSLTVDPTGQATIGSSVGTPGALTIGADAILSSSGGTIHADIVDDGLIASDGMTIIGDVRGAGSLALGAGLTVIGGTLAVATLVFGASPALLQVEALEGAATVTGFQAGDVIIVAGSAGSALQTVAGRMTLVSAGSTLDLGAAPDGSVFDLSADGSGGVLITLNPATASAVTSPVDVPPALTVPVLPEPPINTSIEVTPPADPPSVTISPDTILPVSTALLATTAASVPDDRLTLDDRSPEHATPDDMVTAVSVRPGASVVAPVLSDDVIEHGGARPIELVRFFDTNGGGHFFTSNLEEQQSLLATKPDFKAEGVAFRSDPQGTPGTSDVYRFFSQSDGSHFFTASLAERQQLQESRLDLVYEGVAFYEHTMPANDHTPVYRFFDTHSGGHMFTSSTDEYKSLSNNRPDLLSEGISFYAPKTS